MSKQLFKRLWVWHIVSLSICGIAWPDTPWTIVPITNTTISLPSNVPATVSYRVTNVSGEARTFAMKSITGISQTTTGSGICSNPFTLGNSESCILTLVIQGDELVDAITSGPEVCIAKSNGQPDSQMCYQPASQSASLNITPAAATVLGQSLGGGTVACLGGPPFLNLIVATADASDSLNWGDLTVDIPGAESSDDGAGNTENIVNCLTNSTSGGCPGNIDMSTYAAGICKAYAGGGYTDWFLPAENQLACLCASNQTVALGIEGSHWGSTEVSTLLAEFLEFNTDCNQYGEYKDMALRVRCVRALTL